jgi:Family of unknown function (DUF6879)
VLTTAELGRYIDEHLTREAFRLEQLDRYDVASDGADFERFTRGEPGPNIARKQPWLDRLRQAARSGVSWRRVHVLRTPLTDYLRYECEWGYAFNARAGEDIGIIDLAEQQAEGLPDHDFWLLDNRHAARLHYDTGGRFLGAEVVEAAGLPFYQRARSEALAAAEPFAAWWQRHTEEWREYRAA